MRSDIVLPWRIYVNYNRSKSLIWTLHFKTKTRFRDLQKVTLEVKLVL